MAKVLVIAGTDPTGRAGISVDIATIANFGLISAIAISAVNVQDDRAVYEIQAINAKILEAQIKAALNNCDIKAIKIGMMASLENAEIIAKVISKINIPVILDPILYSSSGYKLAEKGMGEYICENLLPHLTLLTPNLDELGMLTGQPTSISSELAISQAKQLQLKYGLKNILIKGGHANLDSECEVIDILLSDNQQNIYYHNKKIAKNKRGTGCALSSAIAANLSLDKDLPSAIAQAKKYIVSYIEDSIN